MSNQIITTRKSPIDLNDKYDKADVIGTLIVVLLKARNLNDKHSFRKSDVFAQAILNGTQKRTHVDIKGGQHPEWDGEVRFPVLRKSSEKFRKMEVFCFSVEPRSEDLMGKGFVDISETLRTGEFDDWVALEVDGVARGELYLEMTYYANTPAPTPAAVSNKLLPTVQNNGVGLTRHPSKLAPADRLSRPQQNGNVSVNQGPALQNVYIPRPSESQIPIRQDTNAVSGSQSRSLHGTSPSGTPHGLNAEKIGKGSPQPTLSGQKQQPQVDTLPNILRPGLSSSAYNKHEHGRQDSITSPTPSDHLPIQSVHNGVGHVRLDSTESSYTASALGHKKNGSSGYNPYIGGGMTNASKSQHSSPPRNPYVTNFTTPTNPYLSAAGASSQDQRWNDIPLREDNGTPNTHTDSRLGFHGRTGTPLLWQQENTDINFQSNFTFPKPSMPTAYFDDVGCRLDDRKSPGFHVSANNEAHTQARYQSPLPLPTGSNHSGDNLPKTSGQSLDQSRINAIRRAEEEAARRREQELRDMELAMQLDRELNMTEGNCFVLPPELTK